MYYTIYKTTNLINGKIYIGKHQTSNLNDSYLGSGKGIKNAVKKYGRENFRKDILFVFESEKEMNAKEKELITEEFVSRNDTYNAGVGGEGGPHFRGKTHKPDSINKMRITRGKVSHSVDTRKKISASNKNRIVSDNTRLKLSIKALVRNGKTYEEALLLAGKKKNKTNKSKSESLKDYYKNPNNR